ncbi:MAG: aspartate aminotransferase family protein [bacterium]
MNEIEQMDRKHTFLTWGWQSDWTPEEIVDADGCYIENADGKEYLDMSGQLMCSNLGHGNETVKQHIKDQLDSVPYTAPPYATEARARLSKKLSEITPGSLTKSFYSTSGTEANEAALKIARFVTGKHKVISRYRSYHGATYGSISLTGDPRRLKAEPAVPGFIKAPDPYGFRGTFEGDVMKTVEYIDEMMYLEGDTVGAVVLEPVVGSNGILVPPEEYLPELRRICDEHDALLVMDEVMSGFGRTGEWFASEHFDFEPDIITMAKGLSSAYIPLASTMVSEEIAEHFEGDEMLCHGHTYAGHATACAGGLGAIKAYEESNVIEESRDKGDYLKSRLEDLKDKHPSVGDVRGLGLFCGVELVKDPETNEPFGSRYDKLERGSNMIGEVSAKCHELGAHLIGMINTLIIAPPLVISREEIDEGVDILDEALEVADAETV